MTQWITAGRAPDPELPAERLNPRELAELRRLTGARGALQEQLVMVEQQLELLVLSIRDGRGVQGRIKVDPQTGMIEIYEGEE